MVDTMASSIALFHGYISGRNCVVYMSYKSTAHD